MADRRELVLTSARLRRADKLTPEQKEINQKSNLKRRAKRAFAAEPLGESPLSTLGRRYSNISLFILLLSFFSRWRWLAFPFSAIPTIFPLILS